MGTEATHAGEIIRRVFAELDKKKNTSQEEILSLWRELAGERGVWHSRPSSLKNRVLTVRVDSSAWLQELVMRKRRLLKELKRALGKDRITEIRFKIGEF